MSKVELYHGDCLEVMPKLEPDCVNSVICDPPYGTTACKWDSVIDLEKMWDSLYFLGIDNCPSILFSQQPFTSILTYSNIENYKYNLAWIKNKKTNFLNSKHQPLRQYEEICVFYRNKPTYNPQMTEGHPPVNSFTKRSGDGETLGATKLNFSGGGQTTRHPTNVLMFDVVNNDSSGEPKLHSTQKPIALMEYLVKTYTNEGDTVLDFAMGSGTTGVACKNLGRNFIGIEKDEKYFEIAKKRIEEA